jgi:hypothetical protein
MGQFRMAGRLCVLSRREGRFTYNGSNPQFLSIFIEGFNLIVKNSNLNSQRDDAIVQVLNLASE